MPRRLRVGIVRKSDLGLSVRGDVDDRKVNGALELLLLFREFPLFGGRRLLDLARQLGRIKPRRQRTEHLSVNNRLIALKRLLLR